MKLRKVLFWCHLTAGVTAGLIILSMSFTGVLLMFAPQIIAFAERNVRQVVAPAANGERLKLDEIIALARNHSPSFRPTGIMLRSESTAAISLGFGREGSLFVNPYNGEVLGQGSKVREWFHAIEDWHRWLGREGDSRMVSRSVTGACNLAFFFLAVSGVFLWWPRRWRATKASMLFNPRLRGKARNWNWHNVIGFWSSSILVILTLTAAVMSYPRANDLLYTLTGSEPPPRPQAPAVSSQPAASSQTARGRDRGKRGAGQKEEGAGNAGAGFDLFFARAQQQVPGWIMMIIRFPPRGDGPVTISIQEPGAPHPFARSQLTLNRASADIVKWEPYSQNVLGRKLRTWVRALHTGEAFGAAGQSIAGLATLGGCFLVWTGLSMAWRRFRSRQRRIERNATTLAAAVPAEATRAPETQSTNAIRNLNSQHDSHNNDGRRHPMDQIIMEQKLRPRKADDETAQLLILFGTATGNAEFIAGRTAVAAASAGFEVQVEDMARCDVEILKRHRYLLVITSTHGNGEPPETAAPFWDAFARASHLNLREVRFSVLALGNSTYDHFCQCGRNFDAALERYGATRFYPRVECDAEYELPSRRWINGVLNSLKDEHRASAVA